VPLTLPAKDKSWKIAGVEYDLDKVRGRDFEESVIGVTIHDLAHSGALRFYQIGKAQLAKKRITVRGVYGHKTLKGERLANSSFPACTKGRERPTR